MLIDMLLNPTRLRPVLQLSAKTEISAGAQPASSIPTSFCNPCIYFQRNENVSAHVEVSFHDRSDG